MSPQSAAKSPAAGAAGRLVLASSSAYRRALLERFGLPFVWQAPDVDETPAAGESAWRLVRRLALLKARALAADHPTALIIGSDQVAVIDGQPQVLLVAESFTGASKEQEARSARSAP